MNVVDGGVVNFRLGPREHLEDRNRAMLHGGGQWRRVDQRANLAEVALGLRLRHGDVEFERRDAAQNLAPGREAITRERHRLDRALELVEIGAAVEDCADDHVATEAGERVEVSRFHRGIFTC